MNAFTSPEGTSASSPADSQSKHAMTGMAGPGDALDIKAEPKQMSRPGSAKLLNAVPYGGQSFPVAGGVDSSMHPNNELTAAGLANENNGFGTFESDAKSRFGPGSYPTAPMISPSLGGPEQDMGNPHGMKRQQAFGGSYFGNTAN